MQILLAIVAPPRERAELKIFQHVEIGKDPSTLRHLNQPGLDNLAGVPTRELMIVELNAAGPSRIKTTENVVECGLARTVAAQQGDDLTGLDLQVDTTQHFNTAVTPMQGLHLEQCRLMGRCAHAIPFFRRCAIPGPK